MALNAELHIGDKYYRILECEYEFTQMISQAGRPFDKPKGGLINVILVAPDDSDLTLHEWMRDKNSTKDGTIALTVNKNNRDVPKTVQFEDAYCVRLYENFNVNNPVQMYIKVSILAGKITFGNSCEFVLLDK